MLSLGIWLLSLRDMSVKTIDLNRVSDLCHILGEFPGSTSWLAQILGGVLCYHRICCCIPFSNIDRGTPHLLLSFHSPFLCDWPSAACPLCYEICY